MRLENSFVVAVPVRQAWALLNDVPRIVPCMPGTELTETVDPDTWKATMHVKLGPIGLQFLVQLRREASDESALRSLLHAAAREVKGRGGARATIESTLHEEYGLTRVAIVTDLELQGPVAQYGRGVVGSVAEELTSQFADCLSRALEEPDHSAPAETGAPQPVSGFRLLWGTLRRSLRPSWFLVRDRHGRSEK